MSMQLFIKSDEFASFSIQNRTMISFNSVKINICPSADEYIHSYLDILKK